MQKRGLRSMPPRSWLRIILQEGEGYTAAFLANQNNGEKFIPRAVFQSVLM